MGIELGAKNLYKAYGVPALDLTFADKKSLVDRISGNNLITFTRSSIGTYVGSDGLIKTAASGAARFDHNPATGESLGLLVEEARTNLITYSEQFDNAAWVRQTNTTVTANTHVAPDGTTTADTINAIDNQIIGNAAVTASTTYTVSVFIRKTTGATLFPMLVVSEFSSDQQRVLNTNTGQLVVRDAALNTGIQCESVGSYWRVSYSGNVGANTILSFLIYPSASTNGSNYSGGTGSIVAWGAQVEAGAFPTSYIPTVASTVTRAADVASMTGTNFSSWYRQDEGTVFCQGISNSKSNSAYWVLKGTGLNGVTVLVYPTDNLTYQVCDGTFQVNSTSFASYSAVASVKTAAAIKLNNFGVVANGGAITSDTSGTVPAVTYFVIGNYLEGGTSFDYSGTIARLTYYPVRFPDAQLQSLTAT